MVVVVVVVVKVAVVETCIVCDGRSSCNSVYSNNSVLMIINSSKPVFDQIIVIDS